MSHTAIPRRLSTLLTATVALFLLFAPQAGAQEAEEAEPIAEEEITRFTRAYAQIKAIREDFQEELGQTHNSEALAQLRGEMNEQIRAVLRDHELTEEEYDRIHFAVMTDPEARETFRALLEELSATVEE